MLPFRPVRSRARSAVAASHIAFRIYLPSAIRNKMPLPFNKNLDLKLIKLVKDNAILYNTKDSKYMDFDSREVVWQKIGDLLGRPAPICKSRWINIRDMMRRRIRERLRNPNHKRYCYKYEEELTFMLPFFKEINTNDEYDTYMEEDQNCEVEIPNEIFVDGGMEYETQEKEVKPSLSNLRQHKRVNDDINASNREFSDSICQELNPTDPLDVFLITIGSTLRKFSPYYLNQAKSKIFQVVQDYELQQIVNKDQSNDSNT